jgi:FtsH-binding integral membrane protein
MNNYPNYPNYYAAPQSRIGQGTLIQRVSYLLATCLLATAAAAAWADSAHLSAALFLPLAIGTVVCAFAISFTRANPMLSLVLLYGLSVLEGLLLGPMLGAIARGYPYGATIIGEAAGLSALLVAGLGTYVWMTSRDFGYLGRTLFWALIGLIIVGLISFFVHLGPTGHLLYALIGAAIFVGFTLYDFSNIKLRYGPDDYVIATVSLYLDFLNLFLFLLQILMSLSGGNRRD